MRTYEQAIAYAENQHLHPTENWHNLCQKFCRNCVGASAFGTTAYNAWRNIPPAHRHTTPPPPGSLAYYKTPKAEGAGHVVFMLRDGKCYSNDLKRDGKIDIVHYLDPVHVWGLEYLGWIDWTPSGPIDVRTNNKPTPPDPPKPVPPVPPVVVPKDEEDMYLFISHYAGVPAGDISTTGAHYLVADGKMIQFDAGYKAEPLSIIPIIRSSSEAMDNSFFKAYKGNVYALDGTVS